MRQDRGKHSWPLWKEQIISKWENDSWRFEMENSFEEAIFIIERDSPMSWFLKQKDRLTSLHPDISETMTSGKPITEPNEPHDKAPLKCHKCGSTSHLDNTCPKKTRINEIEIEKDDTKETKDVSVHESDFEPSEEEELPDELSIENINVSFEVTEVHTHLPQYSDECMDLIHVQDSKMQKTKPARDDEPLGAIKGHEVDIILNVERPYPPLLRRPAYPASPRAREALESHINDLMKLGVHRQVGHNEEVEVTTAVIITWHNDKSRMVGDFRALSTYTILDRYPIPRIHDTLTQL
ncbi:hypothetical protein O181_091730 [Austropuccinia psidii MF-1]|uniref:CCHC-type domain-containing protein n=1 Tax=Austropuccinia psidii MF-1 TaxID=1389203 RepID=A0A9Q3IX93_9BASI|nr:hypothetical protein [Austropuccinia psidii MF-1]